MGVRDRHSKITLQIDRDNLERLATVSAIDLSGPTRVASGSDRAHRDQRAAERRPTCNVQKDEHSLRAPTNGETVDEHDRRTQEMSPKHFQMLMRAQQLGARAADAESLPHELAIGSGELKVDDITRPAAPPPYMPGRQSVADGIPEAVAEPPVPERVAPKAIKHSRRAAASEVIVASVVFAAIVTLVAFVLRA